MNTFRDNGELVGELTKHGELPPPIRHLGVSAFLLPILSCVLVTGFGVLLYFPINGLTSTSELSIADAGLTEGFLTGVSFAAFFCMFCYLALPLAYPIQVIVMLVWAANLIRSGETRRMAYVNRGRWLGSVLVATPPVLIVFAGAVSEPRTVLPIALGACLAAGMFGWLAGDLTARAFFQIVRPDRWHKQRLEGTF